MRTTSLFIAIAFLAGAAHAQTPVRAWTTQLAEPNVPGAVATAGVDAAPGGDLCAASEETLDGARKRAVVRRYGPDGAERWAHAVEAWAAPQDVFEVVADGADCLVSTRFFDAEPSTVGVARVGAGGVVFAARPDVGRPASAVFVRPDGAGGAWLGIGGAELPAVVLRVDASGSEVARVERPAADAPAPLGVRDLAVTPDGRAVATTAGEHLLVVGPDGTVETAVPLAGDLPALALALDGAGGVFVFATDGLDGEGRRLVRRYTLGGTQTWSTVLGLQDDPEDLRPHSILAADGDAVVIWVDDEDHPLASRLDGATGDVLWTETLGDRFARPREITPVPGGAAVHLDATRDRLVGLDLSDGTARWSEDLGVRQNERPTKRVAAACGAGVCTQSKRNPASGPFNLLTVAARDADGSEVWQAERAGARVPKRSFSDGLAAPGGGLYVLGTTSVDTGIDGLRSNDLLVSRFDGTGTLLWSTPLDGSSSLQLPRRNGIVLLSSGDVAVAGVPANAAGARPLLARLAPDGAVVWRVNLPAASLSAEITGLAATSDGGVTASTRSFNQIPPPRSSIVRFGDSGEEVWRTDLDSQAYPYGVLSSGESTVSLVLDGYGSTDVSLTAVRLNPEGVASPSGTFATETCPLAYVPEPEFTVDAFGTVIAVATSTCGEVFLVRFSPDGTVTATEIAPSADRHRALSVTPDGDAVVAYEGGSDQSGVVRLRPDGSTVWDTGLTLAGTTPDVAALPSGGAVSLQIAPGDGGVDRASVFAIRPDGSLTTLALPSPAGLSVDRSESFPSARIVRDGEAAAYAIVLGRSVPIEVPSVTRVEGLPVASEGDPADASARLLRLVGANPVPSGAPLAVALAEAATVDLFDALGRRVAAWTLRDGRHTLQLPPVPTGVYLVRAVAAEATAALPVVVR